MAVRGSARNASAWCLGARTSSLGGFGGSGLGVKGFSLRLKDGADRAVIRGLALQAPSKYKLWDFCPLSSSCVIIKP